MVLDERGEGNCICFYYVVCSFQLLLKFLSPLALSKAKQLNVTEMVVFLEFIKIY